MLYCSFSRWCLERNWIKGWNWYKESLYYLLEIYVNLQMSQNKFALQSKDEIMFISILNQAAVTKYKDQVNQMTKIYFSLFQWLESPRSRHWQVQCLIRTLFLVWRRLLRYPHVEENRERASKLSQVSLYKDINPIHKGSMLMSSSPPAPLQSLPPDTIALRVRISIYRF